MLTRKVQPCREGYHRPDPISTTVGIGFKTASRAAPAKPRVRVIEEALNDIPTLHSERIIPSIANHVPRLILPWDEDRLLWFMAALAADERALNQRYRKALPPDTIVLIGETTFRGLKEAKEVFSQVKQARPDHLS